MVWYHFTVNISISVSYWGLIVYMYQVSLKYSWSIPHSLQYNVIVDCTLTLPDSMTSVCVSKVGHYWLRQFGSNNFLTNVDLLIGPSETNLSEIRMKIQQFLYKTISVKMMLAKWWPLYPDLNVLMRLDSIVTQFFIYSVYNLSYTTDSLQC